MHSSAVRCRFLLAVSLAIAPVFPLPAAEPERLPVPGPGNAAGSTTAADTMAADGKQSADGRKPGDDRKAAADKKTQPEPLDRTAVYRHDPILAKLVVVPAAEIKKDHVYFRYSPARGRFLYALGPGSVQPVRLFDIRATDEEKRRALESRAPAAAKLFATQGAQPALTLDAAGEWKLAGTPTDGSVFDVESGRRFEWHGDRMVEVVHSGGNSWSRRGGRYVPAGSAPAAGW